MTRGSRLTEREISGGGLIVYYDRVCERVG